MGKALWGLSEWYGYRERLRPRRGRGDPGARDLRADRRPVLGQLVEVHARVRAGHGAATCRAPRATSGPTLREFWASRDLSGPGARPVGALDACSCSSTVATSTATRWAAPRAAWSPRPACTSRPRGRATEIPIVDPDTADPELARRLSRGSAWSRDEAVERALGADAAEIARRRPRPPERRTMAGVHAPERPARRAGPGRRSRRSASSTTAGTGRRTTGARRSRLS